MFYIVSLLLLAFSINNNQSFNFFFKILIVIHVYREAGRLLLAFWPEYRNKRGGYSEYKTYKNLNRFSLEIITGLSLFSFFYYITNWIDFFLKTNYFQSIIRISAFTALFAGFVFQVFFWINTRSSRHKLGFFRLWQGIFLYFLYFFFLFYSLNKIAGSQNIHSPDDFHFGFITKIYSEHGLFFPVLASGNPIYYPSIYGVWCSLSSIIGLLTPTESVHMQPLIINFTLIFFFFFQIASILKSKSFISFLILPGFLLLLPIHNQSAETYAYAPRLVFPLLSLNLILLFYRICCRIKNQYFNLILSGFLYSFIILLNPSCIPPAIIYTSIFFLYLKILSGKIKNDNLKRRFQISYFLLIFLLISIFFLASDPYYLKLFNGNGIEYNRQNIVHGKNIFAKRFDMMQAMDSFNWFKLSTINVYDSFLRSFSLNIMIVLLLLIIIVIIWKYFYNKKTIFIGNFRNFLLFFFTTIFSERLFSIMLQSGLNRYDFYTILLERY